MKCPKCGYLGYERVDRCRNCGYEFSLTPGPEPTPELRLRDSRSVPQPLDDLELVDAAAVPATGPFDELRSQPSRAQDTPGQNGLAELPLFGPPITDDVPLITKASPPRPPLSVRRATPEVPRLRSEARAPLLDWSDAGAPEAKDRPRTIERRAAPAAHTPAATSGRGDVRPPVRRAARNEPAATGGDAAGLGPRACAALIDVALLAVVDLVVVYFTLKICRLGVSDIALLPKGPLIAFLLLQNGGYFVALTTTGQTLGKMIAGLRVLADESDNAPDLGRSLLRALLWIVLALPAGLGLLSAAFSRDGRGLHDRVAGTRVVRTGPPPLLSGASARHGA